MKYPDIQHPDYIDYGKTSVTQTQTGIGTVTQ